MCGAARPPPHTTSLGLGPAVAVAVLTRPVTRPVRAGGRPPPTAPPRRVPEVGGLVPVSRPLVGGKIARRAVAVAVTPGTQAAPTPVPLALGPRTPGRPSYPGVVLDSRVA